MHFFSSVATRSYKIRLSICAFHSAFLCFFHGKRQKEKQISLLDFFCREILLDLKNFHEYIEYFAKDKTKV